MSLPKVSVIIPAAGNGEHLVDCLASVLALDYPDFETIVVDDGLSISARAVLDSFGGWLKILESRSKGPSFARNLAAGNTQAELLAFTDSDCRVQKDWLRELVKGLEGAPGAVACGGIQKLPHDAASFERKVFSFMRKVGFLTDYIKDSRNGGTISVKHNASCNVMYRRDIFLQAGGFTESLWPGEDLELDLRLRRKGYNLVFNPQAVVYHYRPKNLRSFGRMMLRYGRAQGLLVRKYGLFRRLHAAGFLTLSLVAVWIVLTVIYPTIGLGMLALAFIAAFIFCGLDPQILALFISATLNWHAGFTRGLLVYPISFA